MDAVVLSESPNPRPFRLTLPATAVSQLRVRLGHALRSGEALAASARYGVSSRVLRELLSQIEAELALEHRTWLEAPCFELGETGGTRLCFIHARSPDRTALPLLLLHGYSCSLAEFDAQVFALTAGPAGQTFHVVCPSLPGFGLTSGPASPREVAARCRSLMARLGYTRYLVHGSDLGAKLALELAALDAEHVAALHVTSVPAYPADVDELRALSPSEKSRLLRISELESELEHGLPESPVEDLAYALSRLDEELGAPSSLLRALTTSLALAWSRGRGAARAALHAQRLEPAPPSRVPVALHAFPLGAPSLRRLASQRYRIAEWHEHDLGGALPALEQPARWLESVRRWGAQLR